MRRSLWARANVAHLMRCDRVISDLRELAALTSDGRGAQRVAWTPTWARARAWLQAKLAEIDADVHIDAAGNLWAARGDPGAPAVAVGSHLDSVPDGGWLDGALGVVAGLEMLRAAAERGDASRLWLVDWADEEGARFGRSLLGSGAATGTLDVEPLRGLRDAEGVALADALAEHGVAIDMLSEARAQRPQVAAYAELHIEQGPVLERVGRSVGVGVGALGLDRVTIRLDGPGGHAGATPIADRRDPVAAAARVITSVTEDVQGCDGLATVGSITVSPGIPTAIAQSVTFTLDLRHPDASVLARMIDDAASTCARIAAEIGVGISTEPLLSVEPTVFDARLIALAEAAVTGVTGGSQPIWSGPLHDAVSMARARVPSVMLFVRSIGGISHTAAENSHADDICDGVRALAELVEAV